MRSDAAVANDAVVVGSTSSVVGQIVDIFIFVERGRRHGEY